MRILHTSDIHLLDFTGVRLSNYFNKRVTGRLNLALNRSRKHDDHLFDAIVGQVNDLGVDRVVITGDLTNLSLPSEFALCRRKFARVGAEVTVIPGNHDAYVPQIVRQGEFEMALGDFMKGERIDGHAYPFVVRDPGVALIGVSTAVATLPFIATGYIGEPQLERLRIFLQTTRHEERTRIVMLHHPPTPGVAKKRHDLLDLAAFGAVIADAGAELVLHGHEHARIDTQLEGPEQPVPVHGISSGTSLSVRSKRRASFSVYDVDATGFTRELFEWQGDRFQRVTN